METRLDSCRSVGRGSRKLCLRRHHETAEQVSDAQTEASQRPGRTFEIRHVREDEALAAEHRDAQPVTEGLA